MSKWNVNTIKEWINANFDLEQDRTILLICIGIAFFFWLLVKLSKTYKTETLAIATYYLPEGMAFTKIPPNNIRVNIQGSGWDLIYEHFIKGPPPIVFDLTDRQFFDISRTELMEKIAKGLSKDLTILSLSHDELELYLETKVDKKVPIVFTPNISFAMGFHSQDSLRLSPDSVTISGPVSLIDSIHHWHTEAFEVNNLKSDLETDIPLKPSRKAEIQISPPTIVLQIPVEQLTEKSFFVPLSILNPPSDSLKVFPNKIRINSIVGLSDYNKVKPSDFEIVVDLKNVTHNTTENTVPIVLTRQPSLVKAVNFSPKSVEFFIIEKAIANDLIMNN